MVVQDGPDHAQVGLQLLEAAQPCAASRLSVSMLQALDPGIQEQNKRGMLSAKALAAGGRMW